MVFKLQYSVEALYFSRSQLVIQIKKESGEGKWLWFYFLLKLSNFFFAVSQYQTCRHSSKMTWTDCKDGLIKDCCVCLCRFIPSLLSSSERELFLPLPCAILSFPAKTTKKHPNRSVTFLLIVNPIVCLSVLNADLFKIVYSQRFCFMFSCLTQPCRRVAKQAAVSQSLEVLFALYSNSCLAQNAEMACVRNILFMFALVGANWALAFRLFTNC